MGYYRIYPNLYVVLVSPPGRVRKSVAINTAINLIMDFPDIKIGADSITREALIKALADSATTIEITPQKLYTHASLTIVSKELSVFLGQHNFNLLSILTDLYDCGNKWEYKTKNMGVDIIYNVWLNMLGATTSDWLMGSIPLTAIGGGFTSRVLFVVEEKPRQKVAIPFLDAESMAIKEKLQHDLELISGLKGAFTMTDEARNFYIQWYNRDINYGSFDKKLWGYLERKHTHLLKLAMIISASHSDSLVITLDDLTFALDMINSIEPKMVEAFGMVGRSPIALDISDISEVIRNTGAITKKLLLTGIWKDVSPDSLDKSLVLLKQMKFISEEYDQRTGHIIYRWIKEDEQNECDDRNEN
jgi:hypothetical protein